MLESFVKNPDDIVLCAEMALECEREGDIAGAISYFQRAAQSSAADTQFLFAYCCLLRCAMLMERLGDRQELTEHMYLTAIDLCPDRPEAYAMVARNYLSQNHRIKAQIAVERALKSPNCSAPPIWLPYQGEFDLFYLKIQTLYHLGRYAESQKILESTFHRPDLWWGRDALIKLTEQMGTDPQGNPALTYPQISGFSTTEPIIYHYRKYFGPVAHTIFDIGSRDGRDAIAIKEALHAEQVLVFEAHPDCAKNTKAAFPELLVYHFAVTDNDGETDFQVVRSDNETLVGCSSIHADKILQKPEFDGTMTVERVKTVRMDSFLEDRAFPRSIDVVKIDTEGFSWQVLRGFGDWLFHVKLLHVETELEATHPEHRNNEKVAELLRECGFVLVDTTYEWGPGIEDQLWVNQRLALPPHDNGLETFPQPRS